MNVKPVQKRISKEDQLELLDYWFPWLGSDDGEEHDHASELEALYESLGGELVGRDYDEDEDNEDEDEDEEAE